MVRPWERKPRNQPGRYRVLLEADRYRCRRSSGIRSLQDRDHIQNRRPAASRRIRRRGEILQERKPRLHQCDQTLLPARYKCLIHQRRRHDHQRHGVDSKPAPSAGVYTAPQAPGPYIVKATSAADASKSASATVTVSAVVSQPPVITSVSVSNITTNSAAIAWQTSQPADSDVEYGTTADYGNSTPINSGLVTSHSVALAGLSSGTTYHYRVKSRNSSGVLGVSPDSSFATTQPAGGGGGSTSVPLSYNAVTDRTPRPVPALPALGGAGSKVTDPTFGTLILRVT